MKSGRVHEMEAFILQHGSVGMEELCERFDVSINTVRRDVRALSRRAGVRQEVCLMTDAKQTIGRKAAELVRDGDIVLLDSGVTTVHVVDILKNNRISARLSRMACRRRSTGRRLCRVGRS